MKLLLSITKFLSGLSIAIIGLLILIFAIIPNWRGYDYIESGFVWFLIGLVLLLIGTFIIVKK